LPPVEMILWFDAARWVKEEEFDLPMRRVNGQR
jgi:hypothetical protein